MKIMGSMKRCEKNGTREPGQETVVAIEVDQTSDCEVGGNGGMVGNV